MSGLLFRSHGDGYVPVVGHDIDAEDFVTHELALRDDGVTARRLLAGLAAEGWALVPVHAAGQNGEPS